MTERSSWARPVVVTSRVAAAAGAILLCLGVSCGPSDGPAPIVWDAETCAECHMHIGDPRFAAQLRTTDDDVYNFDDVGCLFKYVQAQRPRVAGAWFRHWRQDRWIEQNNVAFMTGQQTPMGYGLAAVERGTASAIDYRAAARVVAARPSGGER